MLIHVVKPGETLWQIAASYRVPVNRMMDVNQLPNPNVILVGQSLVIPTEDFYYTVKQGDTLWRIAQANGTTVQVIQQANQITDPSRIYPGQVLYIPAVRHTVERGQTLWQIAQRYGVSLDRLLKVNFIENPNLIYPGTVLVIPRKTRPAIEVNGYIYQLGADAVPIVNEDGRYLTYLSPFAYRIRENGGLQAIPDGPAVNAALANNVIPMMCITNFTVTELGENLAHIILANPAVQDNLLRNISGVMNERRYRGLNIDFENVLPADRELYNRFLQRATDAMHSQGFFISTALAPKTSAQQMGLLYEAHDYAAHGRIVDFVILMTYEWGYRRGPPQAISPLNEIIRVLNYAVSVIPANKIFFGFQLYARDWLLPHVQGQEAETFDMQEAVARAVAHGVAIQYNKTSESPFFRYTDAQGRMHEVWFEDARSAQAKFDVVKAYNLRGISYWALGYPFPQNWVLLDDNFTIRKL